MANATDDASLHYSPEWYEVGDADDIHVAVLYGLIAIGTIWRVEDLVEMWLFTYKNRVSLSDVSAIIAFRASSWWEVLKWISTPCQDIRISRKALFGIALRLLVYGAEIVILFESIPRTMYVYKSNVPGGTEILFRSSSIWVSQPVAESEAFPTFVGKWCGTDKIDCLGFTPTAVKLICIYALVNPSIRERSKLILSPEVSMADVDLFANRTEFYFIQKSDISASLTVYAL